MNSTIATPSVQTAIDVDEIARTLSLLHPAGAVFEVRGLDLSYNGGRAENFSGYYVDPQLAADHVSRIAYDAGGWYTSLQTLAPSVYARTSRDRLVRASKDASRDSDVIAYSWLPIDVDPIRDGGIRGIMANDSERHASASVADEIVDELERLGWGRPLIGDSGNGRHLLYRIELPVDDVDVVKSVLIALNERYGIPGKATVDTSVFNPARIWRLYGTKNCKGSDCPRLGRVHRSASILERPDELITISRDKLLWLVDQWGDKTPQPATRPTSAARSETAGLAWTPADVGTWITAKLGIGFTTVRDDREGLTRFKLDTCPTCTSHDSSYAPSVTLRDNGMLGYSCFGNSCSGIGWKELRERFDPKPERPAMVTTRTGAQAPIHGAGDHRATDSAATAPDKPEPPAFVKLMTSADLLAADLTVEYLIEDVLAKGQPCVIGGGHKSLKTRTSVDLAVSLASGTPFLGAFPVASKQRVAIWSGESGAATLRSHAVTVADARGVDLRTDGPLWAFDLPKLSRVDHLSHLERVITENGIQVVMIDPLYLVLLDGASSGDASNVFAMGSRLGPIGEIGQRTGATIVLIHHFSRGSARAATNEDPCTLDMLSQAGLSEWARQWLLLQRRSPYQSDGRHELWLRAGGSAGHSSLWSLDCNEGTRETGRRWEVAVSGVESALRSAADERERRKQEKAQARQTAAAAKDVATLDRIMNRQLAPQTSRKLRELSGLSHAKVMAALASMVGTGHAMECEVTVNGRAETGYRYVRNPGSIGVA